MHIPYGLHNLLDNRTHCETATGSGLAFGILCAAVVALVCHQTVGPTVGHILEEDICVLEGETLWAKVGDKMA